MSKLRSLLILLVVAALSVSACSTKKDSKVQTVKVAVALPTDSETEQKSYWGIELALKEAKGKAGKINVELVPYKTSDNGEYSPELEAKAAAAAAADPNVVAYLGMTTSGMAKEAIPVLNQAGLASISLTATWPGLTKPGFAPGEPGKYYPTGRRTFFRMATTDDVQGVMAARWLKQLGSQKIYLVDDGSPYGVGLTGIFEVTAKDAGLSIAGHDALDFTTATPDTYTTIAQHAIDSQADAVYFGGYAAEGGSALIGALRTLKPGMAFMGADGVVLATNIVEENGVDKAEGIYATDVAVPPDQIGTVLANTFLVNYQTAYNTTPTTSTLTGYEAMRMLLDVIAKDPTRAGVLAKLAALGPYSGALGTWSFNADGDITFTPVSVWQIQKGEWKFIQILK